MTEIVSELQKPAPSAIIELFQLELVQRLHGSSETYYFHSGSRPTDPKGGVFWAGKQYLRFPVETDGFEYNGNGQLPRPKLRISNVLNTMSAILLTINAQSPGNDLTGAKLTRIRTLAKFLDAANFPGNVNPYGTPDPTAELPREVYYIDRKTAETKQFVEFELAAAFDLAGVRAPRRQCIANLCQWEYRGAECGYTGSAGFDANDNPITLITPPNFTGGSSTIGVNAVLNVGGFLTSANGWYRAIMQPTGEFVVYAKNNKQVWSSLSTAQATWGPLYLKVTTTDVMISRVDNNFEVWSTYTGPDDVSSFSFVEWLPTDRTIGRQAAFLWEIFGSEPNEVGATRTKTYEFVRPLRTLSVKFTAVVTDAGTTHYSGRRLVWTLQSEQYVSRSGSYASTQLVDGLITLRTSNPYRITPEGTLTEAGRRFSVVGATGDVSYFGLQNDGRLVLVSTSSQVIWQAGYNSLVEPKYAGPSDPGLDVCGKRLTSCEKRFGFDQPLPFGSFPGVGSYYT